MLPKRLLFGVTLVFFTCPLVGRTQPASSPPREVELFGTQNQDGIKTDFVTTEAAVRNSPAWNPEGDDPPLSVARAIALAKAEFLSIHPKLDDAKLFSIQLMSIGAADVQDRWFYIIEFSPVLDGNTMFGSQAPIVLLMDGKAATARTTPRR